MRSYFTCVGGKEHQFESTGKVVATWTSASSDTPMPEDAPRSEQEKCVICGQVRWIHSERRSYEKED